MIWVCYSGNCTCFVLCDNVYSSRRERRCGRL